MASSTLSIIASSTIMMQGTLVTISGRVYPAVENRNVTIYESLNGSPWTTIGITATDIDGRYAYVWTADGTGMVSVRASWSGDENYSGADSPAQSLIILSPLFVALVAMIVVLVVAGIVVFLMTRKTSQEVSVPQPPEIPT
jgi:hypothetical protein